MTKIRTATWMVEEVAMRRREAEYLVVTAEIDAKRPVFAIALDRRIK
jgi:hypothetical protein